MMKSITINVAKVDVEDLVKEFKVLNVDVFISYLKEIWRDLAQRSDDKHKGVSKITFSKYYELPGIISDRLFAVFDKNQNGYIDIIEFIDGMKTLFSENFEKVSKFIFEFYDFDKDGLISKEDIRTVLSYVPLKTKEKVNNNFAMKYDQESFKDRIESQEELHEILEKCFKNSELLEFKQFLGVIENVCSDIFFFILIFLMEKKPFTKQSLYIYEKQRTPNPKDAGKLKLTTNPSPLDTPTKLVASPNCYSKFSPSVTISKSPMLRGNTFQLDFENEKNKESKDYLMRLTGKGSPEKKRNTKTSHTTMKTIIEGNKEGNSSINKVPVNRKIRNNLKNIQDNSTKEISKNEYNDLPITPAVKQKIVNSIKQSSEDQKLTNNQISIDSKGLEVNLVKNDSNDNTDEASDEEEEPVKFEGYLYKITENKNLKKLWFKLFHKDFYYFKNENELLHKGMHNLSGVFVKEEKPTLIGDSDFFTFSVSYPKKVRYYYTESEDEMKLWIANIKKATGYSDLTDIYDVKDKLGNGKFGLVRLGIHKQTGKKVAIKIMNKKDMDNQDLELLKTEIEILKICQHPYIIRLYDVFENLEYVYVIMEHCAGGDLFSYIEKREFKLPETRACQVIHRLCTAVYYIHSYGVTHRDLKPENILMTDTSEQADIRIVDFGLSKIIGPTETCTEPYGTLSYVAPEVLTEQPYTKAVDLWSIGIITYLILAGCLPFDDEHSEKEIARQTIHDPVRWGSIWKKLSAEAKSFVDKLLQKDPTKRMTIKQTLEHPWLQKLNKTALPEIRRKSNDNNTSTFKIYTSTDEVLKDN